MTATPNPIEPQDFTATRTPLRAPDRRYYACQRCGIRRLWKAGRGRTCRDCREVEAALAREDAS